MNTRGNPTARPATRWPGMQVVGTFAVLLGLSLSVHGADDTFVYVFNAADQLTSVTMNGQTVATMSYDGDGLRARKAAGGGEVVYIRDEAGNVLAEYDQDGVLLAEYIYANGHQVAKVERPAGVDTFRFFHPDHLGTALVITDEVGDQDWRGEYFPFGEEYSSQGTPNRYRFVERETDEATGLTYMHARYYNPRLGRFMSVDPVGGRVEDSQSWNRYAYVLNNPLKFVDPTGMAPNQAGTTDPSTIRNEIRSLEASGVSQTKVLETLSNRHGGNADRYFYTKEHGWVDVRHFGKAAATATSLGSGITEVLGFGVEVTQWAGEGSKDYQSGFSPEDLPSNAAGAEFGSDYVDGNVSLMVAFDSWLQDAGALPQNEVEAGRSTLPATDPSNPNGPDAGGRGASNTTSEVKVK